MNTSAIQNQGFEPLTQRFRLQRGLAFGTIIISALIAFEIFNYSTTDFALSDLLGDLKFMGLNWSTILAIAFCAMDFAGIARLFTPEDDSESLNEIWYLFAAWLLAATMNAMLTWWGVSIAILRHTSLGNAILGHDTILKVVPVFVAVLVWLIRVLIIGTISVAGARLFSQSESRVGRSQHLTYRRAVGRQQSKSEIRPTPEHSTHQSVTSIRQTPKPTSSAERYERPETSYHPVSLSASPLSSNPPSRMRQ